MRIPELKRLPVSVTGSWGSRRYVTRWGGTEEEVFVWRYVFTFTALSPIHAIFLMSHGDSTRWRRSVSAVASPAGSILQVPLEIRPPDPLVREEMDVSFGHAHVRLTDAALKDHPQGSLLLASTEDLFTGEVADLATVPGDPPAVARILLLDVGDTEETRGHKWRMKGQIRTDAPAGFSFLSTGFQAT